MSAQPVFNDRFLRACRREPVDRTPVWFMRQAGRYLPEYRALRDGRDMLETCRTPDLAVEVTLQPLRRMPLDAAILFSDIMVPVAAMGVDVRIEEGVRAGRRRADPVRRRRGRGSARRSSRRRTVPFVLEAIRLLRKELTVPLIGFAGAPFTLASYLVEGGPSRNHARTKALMHSDPAAWARLMTALGDAMLAYLRAQVEAGAQAVQVFDSWAGALDPDDYERHVLPVMRGRVRRAGRPGRAADPLRRRNRRAAARRCATAGADVVGRRLAGAARSRVGAGRVRRARSRGTSTPPRVWRPWDVVEAKALDVLRRGRRPAGARVQPGSRRAAGDSARDLRAAGRPGARTNGGERGVSEQVTRGPIGVLVMAYGTAGGPDDVERYYTDIRGGRAPTPEHLEELRARYAAIGNRFPLLEITTARRRTGSRRELNGRRVTGAFRSYLGMKHSPPFVAEGVARMQADGVAACGRPGDGAALVGHVGRDLRRAGARRSIAERDGGDRRSRTCGSWHDHPGFVTFLARSRARRTRQAASRCGSGGRTGRVLGAQPADRTLEDGTTRCTRLPTCARRGARTRRSSERRPTWWRRRSGSPVVHDRVAERGTDGRPVAGAAGRGRDPRRRRRMGTRPWSCARRGSSPTTSRSCTTSTSRRRSSPQGPGCASLGPRCRTWTSGSSRCWPTWCGATWRGRMNRPARVVVVGGGVTGLVAAYRLTAGGGPHAGDARRGVAAARRRRSGPVTSTVCSSRRAPTRSSCASHGPWTLPRSSAWATI